MYLPNLNQFLFCIAKRTRKHLCCFLSSMAIYSSHIGSLVFLFGCSFFFEVLFDKFLLTIAYYWQEHENSLYISSHTGSLIFYLVVLISSFHQQCIGCHTMFGQGFWRERKGNEGKGGGGREGKGRREIVRRNSLVCLGGYSKERKRKESTDRKSLHFLSFSMFLSPTMVIQTKEIISLQIPPLLLWPILYGLQWS